MMVSPAEMLLAQVQSLSATYCACPPRASVADGSHAAFVACAGASLSGSGFGGPLLNTMSFGNWDPH
jgi:hypothetical protein